MHTRLSITITFLFLFLYTQAQDTTAIQLPSAYIGQVANRTSDIEQKLDKKTAKTLQQSKKLEARMKRKMARIDSIKANEFFGNIDQKYNDIEQKLNNPTSGKQYIPSLDTLRTSLKFLQSNSQIISQVKGGQDKLQDALKKAGGLENQFQKAEEVKKFLKERKQFLRDQLSRLGFAKELKKLNKQAYYYSQQVSEYKSLLTDRKKAERKALAVLSKSKLFKDFMRKNSMLASLFRMPADPNDPATQATLAGLQTRTQVNNLIQQQVGSSPTAQAQFRQNIQDAQNQLNKLKDNVLKHGSGNSDAEMPYGFKPNNQKTKSFLQRLEYGTNIQTQKATSFFPVTSDIGLSLGYKLNDKSIVGIGASYKMGMGRGWNNIRISNEGLGLRSFIDWKVKGSFWISGGFEQNYKTAFSDFEQLKDMNSWQESGLIGVSKVVSLKTKFFKKTKLQLLWDFLSTEQRPRTQPIVFRVGYTF